MRLVQIVMFHLWCFPSLYGQVEELQKSIMEEGMELYRIEKTSWMATDLILSNSILEIEEIGGYFSYRTNDLTKCIFYDNTSTPKTRAIVEFDSTLNEVNSYIEEVERLFTKQEQDLYQLRTRTLTWLQTDTMFVMYENTSPNVIPVIGDEGRKVYVLTGPEVGGVMVFGNDYELEFSESNEIISNRRIHKNIIPIDFSPNGQKVRATIHTHLEETGELMTSTDICTLLLYGESSGWDSHIVLSKKRVSIWDCNKHTLVTLTRKAYEKIIKDQKRKTGRNRK